MSKRGCREKLRKLRRHLGFESMESRRLLAADVFQHNCDMLNGHSNLCGVESSSPTSNQDGRVNFTPRSSISSAPPFSSATWAAAVDDAFENNDSFYQAANLGTIRQPSTVNNLVMADRRQCRLHRWPRRHTGRSQRRSLPRGITTSLSRYHPV